MPALFETLSGVIDGVNDVFTFGAAYTPGTVAIYLNGQLLLNDAGNPWTESDPGAGEVTILSDCIPRPGDEIAGFAIDTAGSGEVEITQIQGAISAVDDIGGTIETIGDLNGGISPLTAIAGSTEAVESILGGLAAEGEIGGVLKACN